MTSTEKRKKTELIKKQLISKRNNIKNKLKQLKQGQLVHENLFQPITKHLENIEHRLTKPTTTTKTTTPPNKKRKFSTIKQESAVEDLSNDGEVFTDKESFFSEPPLAYDDDDDAYIGTPTSYQQQDIKYKSTPMIANPLTASAPNLKRKLSFSSIADQPKNKLRQKLVKDVQIELEKDEAQKQKDYQEKLNKTIREKSFTDYYSQYHSLPLKYVKKFIKDPHRDFSDGKLRVKFDEDIERFSIGNKRLDFDGPDILIGGMKYKGTKGLYGLLFNQNVPRIYTKADKQNYVDILFKSGAVEKHFDPNLNSTLMKTTKYKKIIEPLMLHQLETDDTDGGGDDDDYDESKYGQGLFMKVSNFPIDYVHWNDPNELVERLQLLVASQSAGNSSHTNEINSIIEELREANIIE